MIVSSHISSNVWEEIEYDPVVYKPLPHVGICLKKLWIIIFVVHKENYKKIIQVVGTRTKKKRNKKISYNFPSIVSDFWCCVFHIIVFHNENRWSVFNVVASISILLCLFAYLFLYLIWYLVSIHTFSHSLVNNFCNISDYI